MVAQPITLAHRDTFLDAQQQQVLIDIQKVVTSPDADRASIMNAVVRGALTVIPTCEGALIEIKDGEDVVYTAASGSMAGHLGLRLKIKGSLSGLCILEGLPLVCEDSEKDARVDRVACRKVNIRSMVVVPIFYRGEVIGVLKIYSSKPHMFGAQDQLMANFFVMMISAGLGGIAQIEATEALRASEARFERAVRGSNEGIWDWDIQNQTIYYSPRFKELLGYSESELADTLEDWAKLIHPDDRHGVMHKMDAHLLEHVPYVAEYRLKNKQGEYLWFEARGQAEWDQEGQPLRMAGCLTSIHERKQLEQLKSEFVYTVTHELRTPLTALKGALGIMSHMHKVTMPKPAQNMLDMALKGSERLMLLVNDLLDMEKMEAGKMAFELQPVLLTPLLQEVRDLMEFYTDKAIHYTLPPPSLTLRVLADRDRLIQILANLLSNAVKFSDPGTTITLATVLKGDQVVLSVTDQGKGMSDEYQTHVFEKFSQAQRAMGTGLGLHITKGMVEKMHGRIWFTSQLGKGTTFYIELPKG